MLHSVTSEAHETAPTSPPPSPTPREHPRLRVQEQGRATKKRHFARAVRRVVSLFVVDGAILFGSRATLQALRDAGWTGGVVTSLFPVGFMGGWGSISAIVVGLMLSGAYNSEQRWASPQAIMRGVGLGAALAMWQSIDFFGVGWTALRWFVVAAALGVLLYVGRALLWKAVISYRLAGRANDRVILVGNPFTKQGREAAEAVLRRPGTSSLGWLSERGGADDYLGHPSAVWEVLCETGTDTVVLCGDLTREMFDAVVEAAAVAGCRVLSVQRFGTLMASQPRQLDDPKFRVLELTFPASRAGQDVAKRVFDVAVAGTLILVLLPLLAALALWVRLDSVGPILFRQERVGQAGRIFEMWKFRTMVDGADGQKKDLLHLNESGDPRLFKIEGDPRVTRAGTILRRWSLDELPQLFNVVQGHMSLVGPRPFFEADLADYDDHHFIRLSVKPGLTGLWQVRGRSSIVDFEEVVRLDQYYVENWSFWLDLRILAETLPAVTRRTGAY